VESQRAIKTSNMVTSNTLCLESNNSGYDFVRTRGTSRSVPFEDYGFQLKNENALDHPGIVKENDAFGFGFGELQDRQLRNHRCVNKKNNMPEGGHAHETSTRRLFTTRG
jgi:hypothetical protein